MVRVDLKVARAVIELMAHDLLLQRVQRVIDEAKLARLNA